MKKQTKPIIGICLLLAAVLALFLWLNRDNITAMRELQENAQLRFSFGGEEKLLGMQELVSLPQQDKDMIQRSATFGNGKYTYTCISLADALELAGCELERADLAVITGADGYAAALSGAELRKELGWLAIMRDGMPLGNKLTGGTGPFQLVVDDDVFAQRWVRYVSTVEVEYK